MERNIYEDYLKIRIKGKPGKESDIGIASRVNTLSNTLETVVDSGNFVDTTAFNQFRTLSSDRNDQFRMYDEMAYDSIISAALDLYSDDATQYNADGKILWVESEDPQIAQFGNRLIDNLQITENVWSHIYCLVKYGEIYLELFTDDELDNEPLVKNLDHTDIDLVKERKGAELVEYIEKVPNSAELFDLSNKGKTVGFVKVDLPENDNSGTTFKNYLYAYNDNNMDLYLPDKYVHIMLNANTERFPEKLSITFENRINTDISADEALSVRTFNVKRGKSILHDVYKIYREIQLMEDSLLLNRVTRSSIIRLLQIEIGDMPEDKATMILHRYKKLIEQKNFLDKDQGSFTSAASPGPIDNVLYIPTRDGKGAVSMSNLGGDVDVKSIADMDYFKNKLYGALKIPRQFLGETDEGGGFSGGTSLTKLDSRYARTIKRIQNAYISGITTLINIFALKRNLSNYINNFTVKMTSPATTEDAERDETLSNRIEIVDRLLNLIPEDMIEAKTRKAMLINRLSNYLGEPDIAQMLDEDTTLDKASREELDGMDMESDYSGGGSMSSGPDIDFDVGGPSEMGGTEEPVEFGGESEGGEEPIDIDMSDIEL